MFSYFAVSAAGLRTNTRKSAHVYRFAVVGTPGKEGAAPYFHKHTGAVLIACASTEGQALDVLAKLHAGKTNTAAQWAALSGGYSFEVAPLIEEAGK